MPGVCRSHMEMKSGMRLPVSLFVIFLLIAFAAGYWFAPREMLDEEAAYSGMLRVDTTKVLSATVESLREESKLLVFSYKGTAKVRAARSRFWVLGGKQELSVPAVVAYHIDLNKLTMANVGFNEKAKLVTVKLPPLQVGEIAFQPENATTINGGLLTFSESEVEALRKLNYQTARKAMVKQAQGQGLINMAKRRARENITTLFENPCALPGNQT